MFKGKFDPKTYMPLPGCQMGVNGQSQSPAVLPMGKKIGTHCRRYGVGARSDLNGCENFAPTGFRSPDLLPPRQSLHLLRYPDPKTSVRILLFPFTIWNCHKYSADVDLPAVFKWAVKFYQKKRTWDFAIWQFNGSGGCYLNQCSWCLYREICSACLVAVSHSVCCA
jgi:hypothetical protein